MSTLMKYEGAAWIDKCAPYLRRGKKCVPLGRDLTELERKVADILGAAFQGIYHLEREVLHGEWAGWYVRIVLDRTLATFDYDHLTALVVLCHDAAVRLEIAPARGFRRLELMFHERKREGGITDRHPSIEAAADYMRTHRADLRPDDERPPERLA